MSNLEEAVDRMQGVDLLGKREAMENKNCFVAMPFGRNAEEERWFGGWYKEVIEPAITSCGLIPILSAAVDEPAAINDEIRRHLVFDHLVVVDLGGRSPEEPPNPNVMYELGIRHAFGLPAVLLAWEGQRLPFDVGNQRAILSRRDFLDIEPTRNKLRNFIQAAGQGRFYNPMDSVGRLAAIEKASIALGEESLLTALANEVRALRSTLTANSTGPRWKKKRPKIKGALVTKQNRAKLWQKAQELGYDARSWSRFLATPLSDERAIEMTDWSMDEWAAYAKERVGALSVESSSESNSEVAREILDAVTAELPAQPWPQGVHKSVAAKLDLPAKTVSKAIQKLIADGVFKNQIDGVLTTDVALTTTAVGDTSN